MKPLDPRLVRYARSTRGFLAVAVVLGVMAALLVILQARLLSDVIVSVTADGSVWDAVAPTVVAIGAVFATRAVLAWLVEVVAVRASSRAKAELRQAAVERVLALGPASPATADPGEMAALMTRGIDALDSYFARYLPQLVLSVVVPVAVLLTVLGQDILSAVIIAVTLPLIPVFMILIGLYTRARVDRQWRTLAVLSGHFLDLVSGLPTLVVFGRAKEQARAIREIGDRYRSTTMGVLRVSFLSSLALELLATLSVALVAVSVGLRLAEGQIAYSVALFVLLLAPEAYLPLRLVGQHFHAAAEGLGAADRLFAVIEHPLPGSGADVLPEGPVTIHVDDLCVRYPGREEGLGGATFVARPGTVTAIVGASGGGKSTLLATLLGFVPLTSGVLDVEAGGARRPVASLDPATWRRRLAWLPQQAHLVDARLADRPSIADVVRIGRDGIGDDAVWAALEAVGFADEVRDLPDGIATRLAPDGSGLSVGQQQRLAFARALVGRADVVLLDEPTAALDPATERVGVGAIRQLAERGATVIVVAHRPALVAIADQVVRLDRPAADTVIAGAALGIGDHVTREGW